MQKIHQVKTRLVNSYIVEYADKLLVVDVALGCHRYVLGFIEHELKRDIHDVTLVVCTHDDPDHIGGIMRLAALCDAAVAIPLSSGAIHHKLWHDPKGFVIRFITTLREMFRGRAWDMYLNPKRGIAARKNPKFTGQYQPENKIKQRHTSHRLQGGNPLPGFDDWLTLHTPGHSWDSCCYYHAASGALITGDTLLGSAKQQTVVVPAIFSNAAQTQATLQKLRVLQPKVIYPGHGSVISEDIQF